MFNSKLKDNQLNTRQDYVDALYDLVTPVYQLMAAQQTPGRVHLSDSGSVYDRDRRDIEGFMRTLWGIGPLCNTSERAEENKELFNQAREGIIAGTDPNSEFYWGELVDYDQLFVEMGSLATMLILTKDFLWAGLTQNEKTNLVNWLNQINQHTIPPTNWLFFRILVNTFFYLTDQPMNLEDFEADLTDLDSYYLDDGWYFDGYRNQIDYYIPFGMQYYGVLSSALVSGAVASHQAILAERGAQFAATFKDWFTKSGASIPFGRSLTYRFAQSGFWAVSIFAGLDLEQVTLSEAKYLLRHNMHYWFEQPIFTTDNLLSIGYAYPNLVMAEGYNAPGSPYWAMKNFIVLALPDDAEFWSVPEVEPEFSNSAVNPYSRMLLVHNDDKTELQVFTAGQHSHEHAQGESKYEKYVYSTTFGFSVKKGSVLPKQGAFDNTLAVSETDINYQTAFGYTDYQIHEDYVYSKWEPWPDVVIKNFVIPCYPWHFRIHIVETKRDLNFIEGSFSAPVDGGHEIVGTDGIFYHSSVGNVGIVPLTDNAQAELTNPEPNTNLLYERTVLPLITGKFAKGQTLLIDACLGDANRNHDEIPIRPEIKFDEISGKVEIMTTDNVISIKLEEL